MVRTWSADDPKAGLMARKRALIVGAATEAFLDAGYAEASVNHIAAAAGVSIKTLYRHFDSKDDLFSAVIQAACGTPDDGQSEPPPAWYAEPPAKGFALAGQEYLRHALSREQLALYRVVTRDSHRFPEIGRRYHEVVVGGRHAKFAGYVELWAAREGWVVRDMKAAGDAFAGLLNAGVFDEAVQGLREPREAEIVERAKQAALSMTTLLAAGRF